MAARKEVPMTGGKIKRAGTHAWLSGKGKTPKVGDTVSQGGKVRVVRPPNRSAAGRPMNTKPKLKIKRKQGAR